MNKQKFEELKNYVGKKITWTGDNCQSKLMELSILYSNCINTFTTESLELEDISIKLKELTAELWEHYKFNADHRWDTKQEIETQMYRDVRFRTLTAEYNEQKAITDYLGRVFEMIKSTQYAIKSYMDWEKFKAGN